MTSCIGRWRGLRAGKSGFAIVAAIRAVSHDFHVIAELSYPVQVAADFDDAVDPGSKIDHRRHPRPNHEFVLYGGARNDDNDSIAAPTIVRR